MLWVALRNPDVADSPAGSLSSWILGPTLLILGWRVLARRYWAGLLLTVFFAFVSYDWLTGPGPKTRVDDLICNFMFLSLVLLISLSKREWVHKA